MLGRGEGSSRAMLATARPAFCWPASMPPYSCTRLQNYAIGTSLQNDELCIHVHIRIFLTRPVDTPRGRVREGTGITELNGRAWLAVNSRRAYLASSLSVFNNRLKTYLFRRCYETVRVIMTFLGISDRPASVFSMWCDVTMLVNYPPEHWYVLAGSFLTDYATLKCLWW